MPGLSGRRPPQLWLSPQSPPVPPALPSPLCIDREEGVAASEASFPAQTGGPCAHARVPPLRSGSRRGCPVRWTSPVCGKLSNLRRAAGGTPLSVLRADACGPPSPRGVAPPLTTPDTATPLPCSHLFPGSGVMTSPTSRPREPRFRETQHRQTPTQQEPSVSHQARLNEKTDRIRGALGRSGWTASHCATKQLRL